MLARLRRPLPERRSPPTCRASSSTRPKRSRTRPRRGRRWPDLRGASDHGIGAQAAAERAGGQPEHAPGASAERLDLPDLGTAPEFAGNRAVVQHPRRQAADAEGAARPRRPRRLLDLHLHQLHPHAALPERLGQALPQGRADDRRRPHARVPVRARGRQRRRGDRAKTGSTTRSSRTTNRATWNAYGNQYWPAEYFIDAKGEVRYAHFGEGEYAREREGDPRAARRSRRPGRQGRGRGPAGPNPRPG